MNANKQDAGGLPELPAPDFMLRWDSMRAAYYVSRPNIGNTDVYTADQMRAYGELCRAAPAGGESFVTFENGHMKLDVNAFLKSPEGLAQLKSIRAASEHFAPAGSGEVEDTLLARLDGRAAYFENVGRDPKSAALFREAAALLRKLQQGVDYVLVPREPTERMRVAGFESDAFDKLSDAVVEKRGWPYSCAESADCVAGIYAAMIVASQGQEGGANG